MVCTLNIASLASSFGASTLMCLSNLPGLMRPGSMMSGLLVAAMIATSSNSSRPSISVNNWFTTRLVTPESPDSAPLELAIESISSKKITVGAVCLAFLKTSLTPFSDSPTHLDKSSGPLIAMKLASLSFATAFASMVLPVPGIPYNKVPLGGLTPNSLNLSGYFKGHSTASFNSCLASSNPPTSSHVTFGTWTRTSLSADGWISLSADLKSSLVTTSFSNTSGGISSSAPKSGMILLTTLIAASLANASRSAPTNPWVVSAKSSKSTSSARGIPLVWISIISLRSSLSGTPISISRSNLPGLLSAPSRESGLFVAPITTTWPLELSPSIKVNSCATVLLSTSPWVSSRLGAIASNSSINIMDGAFSSASSKNSLRFSSDPPTYLLMISGPLITMKWASLSFATAFASKVLPVPGGPCINTPFGGAIPNLSNNSGFLRGISIISLTFLTSSFKPPMSS